MHLDANTQAGEQMFVWTVHSYWIQEHCLCYEHNSPFILFTLYDEKEKHLNSEMLYQWQRTCVATSEVTFKG